MSLGFGVLGGRSFVATKAVIPAIESAAGARLVSVGSRRHPDGGTVSYEAVLANPEVDVVYLPLPNGIHAEWTQRAAAAGKHVLCEKPLAPTAEQAAGMVAACVDAGVTLFEAWMTPFSPPWADTIERARAADIEHITTRFTFTIGPGQEGNYRWDPRQGGGALLDVGIYALGPAVALWGPEPESVEVEIETAPTGVDLTTSMRLTWPGGRTLDSLVSFALPEAQELRVIGPDFDIALTGDAHTGIEGTYTRMIEAVVADIDGTTPFPQTHRRCGLHGRLDRPHTGRSMSPTPELVAIPSGVTLAVRRFGPDRAGAGPDFLLTHGLASNATLWTGVAEHLAAAGHRVFTFDQRGHGRSSKPDHGYDMATVADDLVQLIDALDLDRPVVGGQSWGGNVVLEATHRHVDRIAAAILVDGGFIDLRRQFPNWEACRDALAPPRLVGTPLSDITAWIRSMAADWPASGREATLENFEVRADRTIAPWLTLERHLAVLHGLWEHEPSSRYADIELPVLIVAAAGDDAERDRRSPAVHEAVAGLPQGRAVWFQPAHHDVHAQKPTEVAAAMLDFVGAHYS